MHIQHDPTSPRRIHLVIAAIVSALGGLLFGYDNIVISGAIGYLGKYFHLDPAGVGWAAGCALIGCIAGAAGAGGIVDWLGQKKGLTICAACFALSSAGIWFTGNFTQFVVWRMIGGLGIGAASIIAPMYIAEIAPARVRGRLVTLYQFGIVAGILAAVVVNMLIQRMGDDAWNATIGWRWMFLAGLVPAILFALMIVPAVESPRWLMKEGREAEAGRILAWLNGSAAASEEAGQIRSSLALEDGHISGLFTTFRYALLIGMMLAGLSQLSGITPVLSFLPEIFRSAGTATSDAFFQSVLVGLVNLAFTLVALWLVDRAGRKTLIMIGASLQFLSFGLVGWFYHIHGSGLAILAFVMSFVAGHAVGNGAVCWVIISEIYPTKVRGRAMSIATTTLWLVGFLGNQMFPILQSRLGTAGTFWCFSAAALLNIFCVAFFVPETKGRTLEQITHFWADHRQARVQATRSEAV